jgi:hypothetical protein
MSWEDIIRRVLPPAGGVSPHTTSAYGATNRPPGSTNPHRGVDFNYDIGPNGQRGINLQHPALRAPVNGVVENAGEGNVGRIAIRDKNGFLHEILHTHTRHVAIGDPVVAGQLIGTMGNTGVDHVNPKKGAYHVHYQMWDRDGVRVNPTDFWDRQGAADPNPAPPAYPGEYRQYLRGLGANAANGFGSAPGTANTPAPGSFDAPSDGSPPPYASEIRRLGRRIAGKSQSIFDTGMPAVPLVPPNDVLSADRQNSFDNRFGNWTSLPVAPPNELASANRENSFDNRFGNWTSSPAGTTPRHPNLPVPPPEPGRPLGIFSGKPMPLWSTPLPLGGLQNNSDASGNNDWFDFLAGLALRKPPPPAPPLQTGGKPERSLGRRIVDPSQASAVDARAPAAPLAPSDDPHFSGGLPGRLVALAGIDPKNPNRAASSPLDDERGQADLQALDARLSSSGNIRDAVALYNARKSSRR